MANIPEQAMSIKGLIQGLVPDSVGIMRGKVIQTFPLLIEAEGDSKLVLSDTSLIIPKHLTNYTVNVDIDGGTIHGATAENESHAHDLASFGILGATMAIKNALDVGDEVYLLSLNGGKRYYILDKAV